ncbi:TetR/AcrR family transcriptional regulator [Deinococcus marmoris]|uniref:Transcriptional regulator, TetR family n=1 Tax=Deinococcus marmoris TaxID=249408 RepID=A0A1U7NR03_9DEIO|nr:TetR/AcrR family transcriptional regulator [Deinococcus marmoris]OLV15345.1 Transcriptional regulator, TetR family [Deinococcus marmoris]
MIKTDQRLLEAAAALLDAGGEGAVTIRAVAQAVGMSHNAPYKHFEDRSALLRAVAQQDFAALTHAFAEVRQLRVQPLLKLKQALTAFISYGQEHPARYRLLFSDPSIAAQGGAFEAAAIQPFLEIAAIVQECQDAHDLPDVSNVELTGLIYASVHGLIDLQAGGRMRQEKGLTGAAKGADLLIELLRPATV